MRSLVLGVVRDSERGIPRNRWGYINNFDLDIEAMSGPEADLSKVPTTIPGGLLEEGDTIFCHKTQHERTLGHCIDLYTAAAEHPEDPFPALDTAFSRLVRFILYPNLDIPEDVVVERVCDLLDRMPRDPVSLATIEPGFCSDNEWQNLHIVNTPSTNTIRVAIAVAVDLFWGPQLPPMRPYPTAAGALPGLLLDESDWQFHPFEEYVNCVSELIQEVAKLCRASSGDFERQYHWFIVKSFLWVSFQRGVLLLLWFTLDRQLKWGYDHQRDRPDLQRLNLVDRWFIGDILSMIDSGTKSEYMCSWAYKSLRDTHITTAVDVRSFHARFATLFDGQKGRCLPEGKCCSGRSPLACQRFIGATIIDQSAHTRTCTRPCRKLIWDEASYRAVSGGRAVCFRSTSDSRIKYTETSRKTLAISHVWSHGQGGRPEIGFNACLHARYRRIAEHFGCDSYWMDAPCIPEDYVLRKESIAKINQIFQDSRVTLVCDADIMSIDVSSVLGREDGKIPTTHQVVLFESILATLLVCDWNVRSWTLLESMRGRQQVHLLLKHERVISLKYVIDVVTQHGRIDIAVLALTIQHTLPQIQHHKGPFYYPMGRIEEESGAGFISKESAANLLSRRHASRPGDDIVIWSLLTSDTPYYSAVEWWESHIEAFTLLLYPGFLVSSVPRIANVDGLSWAPSKPGIHLPPGEVSRSVYHPYDQHCRRVSIHRKGLTGFWGVYSFKAGDVVANESNALSSWRKSLKAEGFQHGVLLQAIIGYASSKERACRYRGSDGYLFGVCGSQDGQKWKWLGVCEWPVDGLLPDFVIKEICIS